jgi:hypothetical protein
MIVGDMQVIDVPVSEYAYRQRITIKNNSTTAMEKGFTIRVLLPSLSLLIAAQKVQLDADDLRVIGDMAGEVHRIVDPIGGPAPSGLSFELAASIPAGATSTEYALYYGRPSAANPPDDGTLVFPVFDEFSPGISPLWLTDDAPTTSGGRLILRANQRDMVTTIAANDGLPIVSAIEMTVRVVDPQSDSTVHPEGTFYYWFGYQRSGDTNPTDPWAVWISRSKGLANGEQKSPVGCEAGCSGATVTQNNGFHYFTIERDPSATRFYRDGTLSSTIAVTNNADYAVIVRNFLAASALEVDYVRARARVTPDPTISLGAEEAL